jgi:hypothetical protein
LFSRRYPPDVEAGFEAAEALPNLVASPNDSTREWVNMAKLRALWGEMRPLARLQKAALACAFDVQVDVLEELRKHATLVVEEQNVTRLVVK